MFRTVILAALAAFLCYFAFPVAGAFGARARWRVFRRRFLAAIRFPRLDMRDLLSNRDSCSGEFQHQGAVEALQGDDRVWIRGDAVTAVICLTYARIYLLPAARPLAETGVYDLEASDESLKLVPWKRFSGLEEGARIFAAGRMKTEGGLPVFLGTPSDPLIVLIYDGRDEDLTRRALWGGRHRNEYWNSVTIVSLTAGFLSTGAALYSLLRPPLLSLPAALVAGLAFSPILPYLPPGLAFLSVYRRHWARARRLRAHRDLIQSGFEDAASKGDPAERIRRLEDCVRKAKKSELLAGLALSAAVAVNFVIAVIVIRAIIR